MVNKDIVGTQCIAIWYVDDLKISFKNVNFLEKLVWNLKVWYRKISLTIGVEHTYGMMNLLEYNDNSTVSIVMINYLKEEVEDFS